MGSLSCKGTYRSSTKHCGICRYHPHAYHYFIVHMHDKCQFSVFRAVETFIRLHHIVRLKGWEPEFKGTGGEAYTTSSPSPYLSLGPIHIHRNEITVTLPALLMTLSNLVPRAFPSKNGWGREKALASAGHVSPRTP